MAELKPCYVLEQPEYMMIPQRENSSLRSISREVDYAWLAGIMDGEGNFQLHVREAHNGKTYFQPKIRVANTDVRMIEKVARIYKDLGCVFFYTINKRKRYNDRWKDQLHIEVASQGSSEKLLRAIIPFLSNKKRMAEIILETILFVQQMPKGGNTLSIDYVNNPIFVDLVSQYEAEKRFYVDPSTTKRRASNVFTW
jgi:hypothetical protein